MIHLSPFPLSASEIRQVRSWLLQSECQLVREILSAHIATIQKDAGALLIEGVEQNDQTSDVARTKAREAVRFNHTLAVLDQLSTDDGMFIRCQAAVL